MRSIQLCGVIFALLIAASSPVAGGGPPALAGKVVEVSQQGEYPLDQARVELLAPGTDKVVHATHTDDRGAYAFRGVAPGSYEIVVKFGKQVLAQVVKPDQEKPRRKIVVPDKPARLNIKVLA